MTKKQEKARERRKIMLATVGIYLIVAAALFVLNLIHTPAKVTVDVEVASLSIVLGDHFPSGGLFNVPADTIVISGFDTIGLGAYGMLGRSGKAKIAVHNLNIRPTDAFARCQFNNVAVNSNRLLTGTRVILAYGSVSKGAHVLRTKFISDEPITSVFSYDGTLILLCNSVVLEGAAKGNDGDSNIDGEYATGGQRSFDAESGRRPFMVSFLWHAVPTLTEQNVGITGDLLFSEPEGSGRRISTLVGKENNVSFDETGGKVKRGPGSYLSLKQLQQFEIEHLNLTANGFKVRFAGKVNQVFDDPAESENKTPTLLEWLDAQHRWTRWATLVGIVAVGVLSAWKIVFFNSE